MTFAYLLSVEGTRDVNARIRSVAFTWLMWLKEPCSQKAFDLCCRIFHRNCDERTQTGGCVTRGVYRLLQRGGKWPSGNHSWRGTPLGWRSRRWAPPSDLLAVWLWLESHFFFFMGCDVDREHFWHISGNTLLIWPPGAGYDVRWHRGLTTWLLSSSGQKAAAAPASSPEEPGSSRHTAAPPPLLWDIGSN